MEHKWGERKTIILFAKDGQEYVHDCWKRSKRRANGIKVVSKQTKKKIWLMILHMNFFSTVLTSLMLQLSCKQMKNVVYFMFGTTCLPSMFVCSTQKHAYKLFVHLHFNLANLVFKFYVNQVVDFEENTNRYKKFL